MAEVGRLRTRWFFPTVVLTVAVEAYLNHDPPDPSYKHVTQAFAAILGEYYRQKFRQAHGLSEPAETACIARFVDGREDCPHNVVAQDDDPNAPPHSPPGDDHSTLWLNEDGDPAVHVISTRLSPAYR